MEFFEKDVLNEAQQVYQMSLICYQEGKTGCIELLEAPRSPQLEKSLGTSTDAL